MAEETKQFTDANSRLKARVRPSVPPRQTSVLKQKPDEPDLKVKESASFHEAHSSIERQEDSISPSSKQPSKLVSFTLRVDKTIDRELKIICSEEGITKETFLEAAYFVCKNNDKMMEELLGIARERRRLRKEKGVQRRAKTMTRYLADY